MTLRGRDVSPPERDLRRRRAILGGAVGVATVLGFTLAVRSFGTDDVARWMEFASGVAQHGPLGVYELPFSSLYNHPPLIGYLLHLANSAARVGVDFPLAIRLPAIVADAVTPFIVFELIRVRRDPDVALIAAGSVALSPAMLAISGFHGNTDPLVVMLVLLSAYLLVDRNAPALGGIALAVALGVKIVPLVALPAMFVYAFRSDWRIGSRFTAALAGVLMLTWTPALLRAGSPILKQVLGYSGGGQRWGITQIGGWLGNASWSEWLVDPGRFVVVLVAAGVPARLVFANPKRTAEAIAGALVGLLVLTPGIGMQYLAWAIAPAYLLGMAPAMIFNLTASSLAVVVYTRWSGGFPWDAAVSSWFTPWEELLAFAVWLTLLSTYIIGMSKSFRAGHAVPVERC